MMPPQLYDMAKPIIIAADRATVDFLHKNRVEFLTQSIRREYEAITDGEARQMVGYFIRVDGGRRE